VLLPPVAWSVISSSTLNEAFAPQRPAQSTPSRPLPTLIPFGPQCHRLAGGDAFGGLGVGQCGAQLLELALGAIAAAAFMVELLAKRCNGGLERRTDESSVRSWPFTEGSVIPRSYGS
jgi:hypothetical protein